MSYLFQRITGLLIATLLFACDGLPPTDQRPTPAENHQRLINMDAVKNLRDLGGYKTYDGREVLWGKLYRSSSLHEASQEDLTYIGNRLGITEIIDFRDRFEIDSQPPPATLLENPKIRYTSINIRIDGTSRQDIIDIIKNGSSEEHDFAELLKTANQKLALQHQQEMRQWFDILLNSNGPFLFHCSEGKDRTGFASALLLSALGVNRDDIFDDYLATNSAIANTLESRINTAYLFSRFNISRPQLRQLMTVDRSYLQAGFDSIEKQYGSVNNYLEIALGLNHEKREKLKQKFLR